jgi:DnaJ-class molecular chaperone
MKKGGDMEQKDYYETLGVSETASHDEIKRTYRKLAFKYHPDRTGGEPEATQKMKEINEAYATLSDEYKRSEYDTLKSMYGSIAHTRFRQTYSEEDIFKGSDINQVFEEFARMFSGFRSPEDLFSQGKFYGKRYKTFEFRTPEFSARGVFFGFGPSGNTFQGGRQGSGIQSKLKTGYRMPFAFRLLNKLFGYFGKKLIDELEIPQKGKNLFDTIEILPEEIGGKIKYPARTKLRRSKDMMIKIPQGIRNGQKIKLKGQGENGRHGGEAGDLYIQVLIKHSLVQKVCYFIRKLLKREV